MRGMRWRRQIIGVGEKIGGNFAAAKEPLQLAAWGKIFLCVGACGFRREGVKLSEVGEGARIPARAAVRPRLDGLRASLAIFSALFSLNFRSLCARVDRGRETRPRAPVWYRARTPSAFFARRRKWRRSRFACLLSLPLRQRGIISHARAALAVMIARRGRLRKVSVQISPLPVLKLYSTTSGETEIQSSPVALDSAAEIARDHSGAELVLDI